MPKQKDAIQTFATQQWVNAPTLSGTPVTYTVSTSPTTSTSYSAGALLSNS